MYSVGPKIPWIMNCIFWGNTAYTGSQIYGSAVVSYSDVQGGWAGAGGNNINEDPLFMDADGCDDIAGTEDDNLRLLPGSPCIDGTIDSNGDFDGWAWGENVGWIRMQASTPVPFKVQASWTGDPILGTCWDICKCAGQPFGDATCDGDIGVIDFLDLGAIKVSFFKCKGDPGYNCCTDFNQDGSVNFLDLGILKVNFFTTGYQPSTGNQNCPP